MMVVKVEYGGVTPCVYVGREYGGYAQSPLANPCSKRHQPCPMCGKRHGKTDSSIPCYRRWLMQQIKERNEAVLAELEKIKEEDVLGCWCCTRKAKVKGEEVCHAEVVWKAWQWLKRTAMTN